MLTLADALGTIWWSALCVIAGVAIGWYAKSKFGKRFTL